MDTTETDLPHSAPVDSNNQRPRPMTTDQNTPTGTTFSDPEAPIAGRRGRVRNALNPANLAYRYGVVIAWVAVIVVFALLRPDTFATLGNFQTIFGSQAVALVLTLALLPTLIAGEFDLSAAGVMSVSLVLVGWLNVIHHWPIVPAVLVALAAGALIGLINAFFIVGIGVDSASSSGSSIAMRTLCMVRAPSAAKSWAIVVSGGSK